MKPRIIARLDIKGPNLIKGIHLEGLKIVGNPNEYAIKYYQKGADELLLMDSVASYYGRNNLIEVIKKTAENVFIPITVGGGIRSKGDAHRILKNGADKVAINTAAVAKPSLIRELAKIFGSQCIVISIEAKKISENKWEVFTQNGRNKTGIDVLDWIKKSISLGAGEILLTSIDKDGTKRGFDLGLAASASKICKVPLIISGGLGSIDDLKKLLKVGVVDGISAAKALHYNNLSIQEIKKNINKIDLE